MFSSVLAFQNVFACVHGSSSCCQDVFRAQYFFRKLTLPDQNILRSSLSSSPSSLYSDSRALGLLASIDKQATFARISGVNASAASSNVYGVSSPSDSLAVPVQKVVVLQGNGEGRSSKSAAGIAAAAPNKFAKT
jgi:hypothetical protein